jgi:hypothetical protein
MASSFTTNKVLEKPGNGDYVDTWNVPVNGDMDIIDQAFGGVTSLNATGGSATLTSAQYRSLILSVSGAVSADVTYTIPTGKGGQWIVYNNTTDATGGPWSLIIASGGGGTSYTVTRGQRVHLYSDGTNVNLVYAYPTVTPIPTGVIVMWSGSIVSIPSGWYLCDGSNSTPDLRNRFVVAAGSTYAVGATGGSADAIAVAHTHTFSATTSSDGAHTHDLGMYQSSSASSGQCSLTNGPQSSNNAFCQDSGNFIRTAGVHTHTVSGTTASTGSSGTNANLPPYYALAYIMKA